MAFPTLATKLFEHEGKIGIHVCMSILHIESQSVSVLGKKSQHFSPSFPHTRVETHKSIHTCQSQLLFLS